MRQSKTLAAVGEGGLTCGWRGRQALAGGGRGHPRQIWQGLALPRAGEGRPRNDCKGWPPLGQGRPLPSPLRLRQWPVSHRQRGRRRSKKRKGKKERKIRKMVNDEKKPLSQALI